MENPVYLPLITGLIGALVGLTGSVLTIWIQSRSQERRDFRRLAIEAAIAEFSACTDVAVKTAEKTGQRINLQTLVKFIFNHYGVMLFLERGKRVPKFEELLNDILDDVRKEEVSSKS